MMTYSAKLLLLLTIYAQLQPPISAINVNLSSIWSLFGYTDNGDDHEKRRKQLVFPRRDLIQELGGDDDEYKRLVQYALGLDGNKEEEAKGASDDTTDATDKDESILHYGVDVSFPMQRHEMDVVDNEEEDQLTSSLKQSQLQLYSEYVNGCNEYYNKKYPITTSASTNPCTKAEEDRFDMNLNQPPVMQNYTMLGFQKTTIPKDLHQLLSTFWKKHQTKQKLEVWDRGEGGSADTHLNHWSSPTYMVHIDNPYFEGGGMELKNYIWHVARQKLENWINNGGNPGQSRKNSGESNDGPKWTLSPTSLYGIRVYKSNSILAPHVDRLPLVTSAIINVDQDVDEDWPLEVIGHDGVAYNITMKPGEMLLYESHSLIHGSWDKIVMELRCCSTFILSLIQDCLFDFLCSILLGRPYPLKGKYYANIFVHFEPSGHCIRHADRFEGKDVVIDDAKDLYERAQANLKQRLEDAKKDNNGDSRELSSRGDETDIASVPSAPAYIAPHTFEEKRWNQELQYAMDLVSTIFCSVERT